MSAKDVQAEAVRNPGQVHFTVPFSTEAEAFPVTCELDLAKLAAEIKAGATIYAVVITTTVGTPR